MRAPTSRPAPVLKYPGAKWTLASWIVSHMPPHTVYVEPFFGSGAVLFRKPRSRVELVNDLDDRVVNLFRVLRERPDELERAVRLTPYSRTEYLASYERSEDPLEDARRFLVRSWQAHALKVGGRSGWRYEISDVRGRPACGDWLTVPQRIQAAAERLSGVYIECRPAEEVIAAYSRSEAAERTLFFIDPPYLLDSRPGYYRHEMTAADHARLLGLLDAHPGPVLLSGYPHPLYEERLSHWHSTSREALAEKGRRRTEVLWLNPAAAEALEGRLF
ncbi:DNA adenine methylase [Rubrobacter calidifluminis]|uniref:DNA adenine methylase n=1 Tax=Rubrobacter calidifluminis TaxID=1392640 RepID=UPI00235DE801|nr:DNA adenine methylase [Rubrobacter calidifluminis]